MKRLIHVFIFLNICCTILAETFEHDFSNKTLRIDYLFSGNSKNQYVSVKNLSQLPQWTGRRHNLDSLLRKGNGQILVKDQVTGRCIYKESFSSLFQEWLSTPEAGQIDKSFENSFLIPFPLNKVSIEVLFRTPQGTYELKLRHTVDPQDILIEKKGLNHITGHYYAHRGGDSTRCINVAILAEGFTKNEMPKFRQAAQTACEQILKHKPFDQMKDRFNFIVAESPSEDSGVSVPRQGVWMNTACGSHFDTFYSDRYLTTENVFKIHDLLAGIPYNHIIILANTNVYGGGGIYNAYTLTTTEHPEFKPVVVHEFGHSFGGLSDEYYYENDVFDDTYSLDVEPWEPNLTTLVDFDSKWKNLMEKGTPIPTPINLADKYKVGVYEGGGYSAKHVYRSAIDCRMKTNSCDAFCQACQQAMEQLIKFYTE